jgi:TRAP transporter TAXI family solute receptor
MQDATFTCSAQLVPIADTFTSALGRRYPFYTAAVIPGGTYRANPAPTPTIGMRATLVATEDTPSEVVREVTAAMLDHLDELRTLHLAFVGVDIDEITRHCVFAPLHSGASRYYRERGLQVRTCPQVPAG